MLDLFFFEKVVESSNIKCLKMFSYELFTRNVWGRSMTCGENMGLFNLQLFQVKVTTTDKKKIRAAQLLISTNIHLCTSMNLWAELN